jgi:hypothetical protein
LHGKKNNKNSKKYGFSSEQMFDFKKPKYNGWNVGHGVHGSTKYDRNGKYQGNWEDQDWYDDED